MRKTMETPIGTLVVDTGECGLLACGTWIKREQSNDDSARARHHMEAVLSALAQYMAGERLQFEDLTLAPEGTPFQQAVWRALCELPFAATASYRDIAERIGRPRAVRAVGQANGRNPIGIIQPCHRVIGADGTLVGFGGGLPAKRWLLQHERRVAEGLS